MFKSMKSTVLFICGCFVIIGIGYSVGIIIGNRQSNDANFTIDFSLMK